jgi:hypothetical protein
MVNEGDLGVNALPHDFARRNDLLASHGSFSAEVQESTGIWDYAAYHTNGAFEEQRKVGHNAMEIWDGPTLTNETSRYPDVGMWRGASRERTCQLAFDAAAGAALLCAGSCFHSAAGKASVLFDADTEAVAQAWVQGARSVDLSQQDEPYQHRADLEGPDDLRVYQRGSDIVHIRR